MYDMKPSSCLKMRTLEAEKPEKLDARGTKAKQIT